MSSLTPEDHLVYVIRATNRLESSMKDVIASFLAISETRSAFLRSHVLNNAVMPFAAKVKVVQAIAKTLDLRINREAMHTVQSRRNAFAHQDHLESIRILTDRQGVPDVSFVVEAIKGAGDLDVVSQADAFAQFVEASDTMLHDLDCLLAAVRMGSSAA